MAELLEALHLEIPQIITHAIGFLIALWILKKYAWKPLLALLDERRAKIQNSFDELDTKHNEADVLKADYEKQLHEIDAEARKRMNSAIAEGEKIASRIRDDARTEATGIIERGRAETERDIDKAKVALKEDMVAMALSATEKIIYERLDDDKHRQLVGRFIDQLGETK